MHDEKTNICLGIHKYWYFNNHSNNHVSFVETERGVVAMGQSKAGAESKESKDKDGEDESEVYLLLLPPNYLPTMSVCIPLSCPLYVYTSVLI